MSGLPLLGSEDHQMDIAAWLHGLGLEQYAPAFRDNEIDGEVLRELTAEDLMDHRRYLGRPPAQAPGRHCRPGSASRPTRDAARSAVVRNSAPTSAPA